MVGSRCGSCTGGGLTWYVGFPGVVGTQGGRGPGVVVVQVW